MKIKNYVKDDFGNFHVDFVDLHMAWTCLGEDRGEGFSNILALDPLFSTPQLEGAWKNCIHRYTTKSLNGTIGTTPMSSTRLIKTPKRYSCEEMHEISISIWEKFQTYPEYEQASKASDLKDRNIIEDVDAYLAEIPAKSRIHMK